MKTTSFLLASALLSSSLTAGIKPLSNVSQSHSFTENKGQVHDQNFHARSDVRLSGTDGQMVFHLKNDGVSYQLSRVDKWTEELNERTRQTRMVAEQTTIYRVDVSWVNANADFRVKATDQLPGYSNYYLESCPNGALNVRSYGEVVYENIYNGIDLKWYFKNGHLEYDYIVAPGADYRQIQLRIDGAGSVHFDRNGALVINTPLGPLTQQAPVAIQQGRVLKSAWVITKEGTVGFSIGGYDPALPLVIDPVVRSWGTYYGGSGDDACSDVSTDGNGDVYVSSIVGAAFALATSGAHQVTYGGNTADAYLAKFSSAGVRLWSTYYGSSGKDFGTGCATDASGNVYLSGTTTGVSNNTIVATSSGHQPGHGGGYDAFLVKFNSTGVRQWGTFYGGPGDEVSTGCATDAAGNVFMCGHTESSSNIASPGSHQPAYGTTNQDAYLVKFNSSGVRQWGTYYGSTVAEYCWSVCSDGTNVFIAGYTQNASSVLTTPGTHQPNFGGGFYEGFLAKFDGTGVRQWGTYYGGNGDDIAYSCSADAAGNVFLSGTTTSGSGIASPGAHQTSNSSFSTFEGFIAKFNASGIRQWGTYYGGTGSEYTPRCFADANGDVLVSGGTSSSGGTSIATMGSHQPAYGGGASDAFLAKFNGTGVRQWATYYGGTGADYGSGVCTDASGNIYLSGNTASPSGPAIASNTAHQKTFGGGFNDAFLTLLVDCTLPSPVNTTPLANRSICSGSSASLTASGNGTITWYSSLTSTAVLGTGSAYVTPPLATGTHSFFIEAQNCVPGTQRAPVGITVFDLPVISITSSKVHHCIGSTTTLTANGANTFTWSNGGGSTPVFTVAPVAPASYTVSGTNSTSGCTNTAVKTLSVVPAPQLTVSGTHTLICDGESATITVTGANTYSWALIGTGAEITVTPAASEDYTVTGVDKNGCTDTAAYSLQVDPCTGVRDILSGGSVEVYPNPFHDKISIRIEGSHEAEIEIVNLLGEVVYRGHPGVVLELAHLNRGLYLIRINGSVKGKVIKD